MGIHLQVSRKSILLQGVFNPPTYAHLLFLSSRRWAASSQNSGVSAHPPMPTCPACLVGDSPASSQDSGLSPPPACPPTLLV